MASPARAEFSLPDLLQATSKTWHEFFRVPALSLGLYTLEAGEPDRQRPHDQDEIYIVLEGAAVLEVDGETLDARPGAVLYVAAGESHAFREITERLRVLVVFAPAETES